MSVSSISDLSRQHMLSILGINPANKKTQTLTMGASTPSASGSNQLSPFAQVLVGLHQLQHSNAAQYSQVTQLLSTNLSTEATNAKSSGNSKLASQLTKLSQDFAGASQSGQMPNVQDIAKFMHVGSQDLAAASVASTAAPHVNALQVMGNVLGKMIGI